MRQHQNAQHIEPSEQRRDHDRMGLIVFGNAPAAILMRVGDDQALMGVS